MMFRSIVCSGIGGAVTEYDVLYHALDLFATVAIVWVIFRYARSR